MTSWEAAPLRLGAGPKDFLCEDAAPLCLLGEGGPCVCCGSPLAQLVWGLVGWSEELQVGLDSGAIELGGRVIPAPDVLTHRCRGCGRRYILRIGVDDS